jgi:hypothetical protein
MHALRRRASADSELASKTRSPRLIGGGVNTLDTQALAAKSAPWPLRKRGASAHARRFLQRARLVVGLLAEQHGPVGVGDLCHVDIAAGIDCDAVRGDELRGRLAQGLRPEPRQHVALRADRSETRGPRFGTPEVSVATVSGPSSPTMASGDLPRVT